MVSHEQYIYVGIGFISFDSPNQIHILTVNNN